jgi:rubrerythrin
MESIFDLERYLENSKKVDMRDLDFSKAKEYPLTEDEIRCLTYMMDIESHTLIYMKGLLRTCAIEDPEVVAFLSCWVYEEFFHGRALRRFLEAAGVPVDASRMADVRRRRSWRERIEEAGASIFCHASRNFQALYLAWGAIQERSTLEAYDVLARRTGNPILRELLQRIIKDERRHYAFYFNKARPLLRSRAAQKLTSAILRYFWTPVGDGVKGAPDVQWTTRFVFGDLDGLKSARSVDASIARLPGLNWFDLVSRCREAALQEL